MREKKVLMIYKRNERAKITIETTAGDTNEIVVLCVDSSSEPH